MLSHSRVTLSTLLVIGLSLAATASQSAAARVLYLGDRFPNTSAAFSDRLLSDVRAAGFEVDLVNGSQLRERLDRENGPGSILLMPNAPYLPADAKGSVQGFLKRGNHLLAVSGPALGRLVVRVGDDWLTRDQAKQSLLRQPGRPLAEFSAKTIGDWERSTASPSNRSTFVAESSGDPRVPSALHMRIPRLDDWEILMGKPGCTYPDGYTAMTFWAKGGKGTPELVVQWYERDGSRWFVSVKLTPGWKQYVLTADDFAYWYGGPEGKRGKPGDLFHPENADKLSFGLADGMSKQPMKKPHEFWVAGFQAVRNPYSEIDFASPILESISPEYRTYRTSASRLQESHSATAWSGKFGLCCPVPRTMGFGCESLRPSRMIPLMEAYDAGSTRRGIAAHYFVNTSGEYAGSVWGYLGVDQISLPQHSDDASKLVVRMLRGIDAGVFLANAGTDRIAYTTGESARFGGYVVNLRQSPVEAQVHITVSSKSGNALTGSSVMSLNPGERAAIPASIIPNAKLPAGEYTANVVLSEDGATRDVISYPFRVVKLVPPTPSETVTTRGGDFYLGARKWHPVGINYYPRNCIGMDDFQTWIHWLSPAQYNPYMAEEDLAKMQSLGINMVSTTSLAEDESPALMDFLARAWNHGIRVNLYLPGLHPLFHYPDWALKLITGAHLADSKALFAYDLGIEVHVGPYADRKQFDPRWQSWVIDRYGSVETAERDWGFTPESAGGTITGPRDEQLMTDGEWRRYVAAYRRFWDDEISKGYRTVRRFVKDLDPHHLIGAKSGWAGTGAMAAVAGFAFDLASGAKHLDFTSPEAYGLSGDRNAFMRGGLNTAYGRFVSGGKPVFWCEFGPPVATSLRPDRYTGYTPEMLDAQREYYRNVTNMVCESGANGLAGWWWPAGYRIDENSDYGIMNQDQTLRPSALEFPAILRKIGLLGPARKPTTAIAIDRDRFVAGYAGIYAESSGKYAEAVSKEQVPELRTEGTGTTSANTPLVAVGNVPCNGHNPPKHLNAEFNWVRIDGKPIENGASVEVERGKPIHIEASVGNVAEAKWLAPKGGEDGSVYLVSITNGNRLLTPISSDTPFLGDASVSDFTVADGVVSETSIVLKMTAKGRTDFGEVFRVRLGPK